MIQVALDSARNMATFWRIGRDQTQVFTFVNMAGGAFSLSNYTFNLFIKRKSDDATTLISLLSGSGLVKGASTLQVTITKTQIASFLPSTYYWELTATDLSGNLTTWFCGDAEFHTGKYDGVGQLSALTVNIGGTSVSVTIAQPGDILDAISIDVTQSSFTLDGANQKQRVFVGNATITANKSVAMINNASMLVFNLQLKVTGTVIITFPSNYFMSDSRWNSGSKLLTLTAGTNTRYELSATYDPINNEYKLKASPDAGYV
jgi:hypothetical protein